MMHMRLRKHQVSLVVAMLQEVYRTGRAWQRNRARMRRRQEMFVHGPDRLCLLLPWIQHCPHHAHTEVSAAATTQEL